MAKSSDQFDWVTAYLESHGLLTPWRRITFVFIAAFAMQPLIMLWSPAGPRHPVTRAMMIALSAVGLAGASLRLKRWPTRRQSSLTLFGAMVGVATALLTLSNPYVGLTACTTFAILGGYIAYFHGALIVLANSAVAVVCAAILSGRVIATTGDIALTCGSLIIVAALNIGVPFGVRSLVHTLRTDLQSSDRDSLTGLHNRRSFYNSAYELIMLHRSAPDSYLVIVMIDLDDFKRLNDAHGHAAGDQALVAVAAALRGNCRPTAVIGRAGGEEFVIADIDTTPDPSKMAGRLCDAIAAIPIHITASIGTSSVSLSTGLVTPAMQLIDDLIRTSDAAMYQAKRAGGNQVCHYAEVIPPLG